MKTFVFTSEYKKCRYYNEVFCKIYRIKNNKPELLCTHSFNTGSCKGEQSEVFTALHNNGFISKRAYNQQNGYYINPDLNSNISITQL